MLTLLLVVLLLFNIYPGAVFASQDDSDTSSEEEVEVSETVIELMKKAEQGDAKAQASLGYAYLYGEGIKKDYEKAAEWYTKSAEQGYAMGQCGLGYMYEKGLGVEKNYEKAAE